MLNKTAPAFIVAPAYPGFRRVIDVAAKIRELSNGFGVATDSPGMAEFGKHTFKLECGNRLVSLLGEAIARQCIPCWTTGMSIAMWSGCVPAVGCRPASGTHLWTVDCLASKRQEYHRCGSSGCPDNGYWSTSSADGIDADNTIHGTSTPRVHP